MRNNQEEHLYTLSAIKYLFPKCMHPYYARAITKQKNNNNNKNKRV